MTAASYRAPRADASDTSACPQAIADYARLYHGDGRVPIALRARAKRPIADAWQSTTHADVDLDALAQAAGLGIVLGAPSGGLCDVDLDCGEAVRLAPLLLPPTPARWGRPGRESHRGYVCADAERTIQYRDPTLSGDAAMLVELRTTGGQTLVPPSIYPDGEPCVWHATGGAAPIAWSELRARVERLAAAALLARNWPLRGSRHAAALALAGALARARCGPAEVADLLGAIAQAAGDEEWRDRETSARTTATRIARGERVTGLPTLATLLDPRVVDACARWLGIGAEARQADAPDDAPRTDTDAPDAADAPHGLGRRAPQADTLLALAERECEVWRDTAGVSYATVPIGGARAHVALRGHALASWLRRAYHAETGSAPSRDAIAAALGVLEGQALYGRAEYATHLRVARDRDRAYLDLGDATRRAVEIDARGWRIVASADVPVRFRRGGGMQALPEPVLGGSLAELRELAPLVDDDPYRLCVGWLLAALRPGGPYPVLHLVAEHGTGKTTLARMLRRLVDPHAAEMRGAIREPRDLAVAADNAHVVGLDNLSHLADWTSDALCCLATGGGFATRELYADRSETIFAACRPVILTGISEVATRGDLLDRSVTVPLARLASPRPEAEVWREYDAARPRLLGSLLSAVSAALAHEASTPAPRDLRMIDAAQWVAAAEAGGGVTWQRGEHAAAVRRSRAAGHTVAIEASAIGPALLALLDALGGAWSGTASDLLAALEARLGDRRRPQGWPRRARDVGAEVRRLAPALRAVGVEVSDERTPDRERRRMLQLRQVPR